MCRHHPRDPPGRLMVEPQGLVKDDIYVPLGGIPRSGGDVK